ncbi:ATP-binding protein [Helicobacter monodelphidis]|uniref:MinD/ParA family protein n=1 Tax=Helicobacter sp. 15-1451 TaxID=2004995 RepID=UPI000DCF0977|nr:MinD/ParA family protein [Helicobacter sp. 15-1451]RAX58127.1 ATP-binding protein [Helicobacter sp. 15-1451]
MSLGNQAHKLEELILENERLRNEKGTKFIAVTSGKGGVGKSTICSNLSYILYKLGFKVAIFDADIGLANLDIIFGVKSEKNLLHALKGECSLRDIIIPIESDGLFLIPGESGAEILKYSGELMFDRIIEDSILLDDLDFVLVDTGAGIGEHTQSFLEACDEVIVVTMTDPAALTDAYATIKICSRNKDRLFVVINMVKNSKEAQAIFDKFNKVAREHIDTLELDFLGALSYDGIVTKATKGRKLFASISPFSTPSVELEEIARHLAQKLERKVLPKEDGRFGRFFEKILKQF